MKKYWYWDEESLADHLKAFLNKGKAVAGTSDTVIGLLAAVTADGKDELDRIKIRNDKPYLVLISSVEQAAQFSDAILQKQLQSLLQACWPGPLTVIVKANQHVPSYVTGANGTIALRVPQHDGLQRILPLFDGLFSTSANITGKSVPASLEQLDQKIAQKVALIIDDRKKTASKPSTIIDCTSFPCKLVREGAYPRTTLEKYIKVIS